MCRDNVYKLIGLLYVRGLIDKIGEEGRKLIASLLDCDYGSDSSARIVDRIVLSARPSASRREVEERGRRGEPVPHDIYLPASIARMLLGDEASRPGAKRLEAIVLDVGGKRYIALPIASS